MYCMCPHAWPKTLILSKKKVVAMTVGKASDMDVAAKKQQILKHGHFTHIFNPAAQKIYTITTVSRWAP